MKERNKRLLIIWVLAMAIATLAHQLAIIMLAKDGLMVNSNNFNEYWFEIFFGTSLIVATVIALLIGLEDYVKCRSSEKC